MALAGILSRIGRAGLGRLRQQFPKVKFDFDEFPGFGVAAVSYTHLTLPTTPYM